MTVLLCPVMGKSLMTKLCGGCPRDLFKHLPHPDCPFPILLDDLMFIPLLSCVCLLWALIQLRKTWCVAGAVHLETQHTAASAKDIEMWLCVSPKLLAMAGMVSSAMRAKCNVHILF